MTKKRRNLILSIIGVILVFGVFFYLEFRPRFPRPISPSRITLDKVGTSGSCSTSQVNADLSVKLTLEASDYDKFRCFTKIDGEERGEPVEGDYPSSPSAGMRVEQTREVEIPRTFTNEKHTLSICCFKGKKETLPQGAECKEIELSEEDLGMFCVGL